MCKNIKKTGFSLVELSIVLIIIGLLISGVVASKQLINQAKIRNIISNANNYQTAINTFVLEFDQLPGDFNDAVNALGCAAPCVNGNNNGQITTASATAGAHEEGINAWAHLSLAETINGSFSVPTNNNDQISAGTNLPDISGIGAFGLYYGTLQTFARNHLTIAAVDTGGTNKTEFWDNPALTTADAKKIDSKIDDGIPTKGNVLGEDGGGVTASDCDNSGVYNLSKTAVNCILYINIDN